jgi:pimeloyl-ACP methyl ester carboxylesterase
MRDPRNASALVTARRAPMRPWLVLLFLGLAGTDLAAQTEAPASPPAHWGPISIDLEEIEYPFPVSFLERELFGQTVRLAYMDVAPAGQANGRTVLLTHGASYYGWYWKETIEALRDEGYRVVVEDRLGWGKSSKPLIPYSWHLHAENTKALLDHLGIEQAAVVGHSMGGQMVTRFARLYPEATTHVVLVNAIGLPGPNTAAREAPAEPVVRANTVTPASGGGERDRDAIYRTQLQLEQRRVVEWKPDFLEHVRIRFGNAISDRAGHLDAVRAMNQTGDSMVGDLPLIRTPALVMGGAQDGPNYPDNVRSTAERLPNGQHFLIPDAGHNPHLETPDILNRELIRFLGS